MMSSMDYFAITTLAIFLSMTNSFIRIASGNEPVPDDTNRIEGCECGWTEWMSNPVENSPHFKGDNNSYAALRGNYDFCDQPITIECRSIRNPDIPFEFVRPKGSQCDVTSGFVCISHPKNKTLSIKAYYCEDFEIRVECCNCSEDSTTTAATPFNLLNSTLNAHTLFGDITHEVTSESTVPDSPPSPFPIAIIIVIVAALLLVLAIVLCVVLTHKDKKQPKFSHHYMPGDSYLQRPVSFTEVDLMRSDSTSSSESSKSAVSKNSSENRAFRFTKLNKAKLELIQAEQDDQPDVVSSTKRTNHEPILRHMTEPRRWLPDEFEKQRQELLPVKVGKKSMFARAVPPPVPPPPPIKKSVAFPDGSKQ